MLQQEAIWHNVCWQALIFTVHKTVFFTFCGVATSLHLYLHVEHISQYVHPKNTIALAEYQGQRWCLCPNMVPHHKITFHSSHRIVLCFLPQTHTHTHLHTDPQHMKMHFSSRRMVEVRLSFMLLSFHSAGPNSSNPFYFIHGWPCQANISKCKFGTNKPLVNTQRRN